MKKIKYCSDTQAVQKRLDKFFDNYMMETKHYQGNCSKDCKFCKVDVIDRKFIKNMPDVIHPNEIKSYSEEEF